MQEQDVSLHSLFSLRAWSKNTLSSLSQLTSGEEEPGI